MKSSESNSALLVRTRGLPLKELSTARRPWPALVFGTMQSADGALTSLAVSARHSSRCAIHRSHASPRSRYHASRAD
jgi:hypothetical protein